MSSRFDDHILPDNFYAELEIKQQQGGWYITTRNEYTKTGVMLPPHDGFNKWYLHPDNRLHFVCSIRDKNSGNEISSGWYMSEEAAKAQLDSFLMKFINCPYIPEDIGDNATSQPLFGD